METSKNKKVEIRFNIEKLEERIAPAKADRLSSPRKGPRRRLRMLAVVVPAKAGTQVARLSINFTSRCDAKRQQSIELDRSLVGT